MNSIKKNKEYLLKEKEQDNLRLNSCFIHLKYILNEIYSSASILYSTIKDIQLVDEVRNFCFYCKEYEKIIDLEIEILNMNFKDLNLYNDINDLNF